MGCGSTSYNFQDGPHHKEWPAPGISSSRLRSLVLVGVNSIQGVYTVCVAQPSRGWLPPLRRGADSTYSAGCHERVQVEAQTCCACKSVFTTSQRLQRTAVKVTGSSDHPVPSCEGSEDMKNTCPPTLFFGASQRAFLLVPCPCVASLNQKEVLHKEAWDLHEVLAFPKHRGRGYILPSHNTSGWQ